MVENEENVIIAGDLNCMVDKPDNNKTVIMLLLFHEEGFTLLNKREDVTYMARNGASTIDLA